MASETEQSLIEARTLITHLQSIGETHKAALARELHDTIGSLMLAAVMDLAAATSALPANHETAIDRLKSAQLALQTAISSGRRMVEQLRPTILDTFGLFAALHWRVKVAQEAMSTPFTDQYPETQPELTEDIAVAMFRVAEEAISMTLRRGNVSVANLKVEVIDHKSLHMEFYDNGVPESMNGFERGASVAVSSMRHRLELFGGTIEIIRGDIEGTTLKATIPLPIS
jgi:signal transduction histidine kinase